MQRTKARSFWESIASKNPSGKLFFQRPDAENGAELLLVEEVLALLPDIQGKDILELGAGTGIFTEHFAKKARSVFCVEFVPAFLAINRNKNEQHGNVTFLERDVTELDRPADSFDLIFCHGILSFMSDEEVHNFFTKALSWLRPGGHLFFREVCFKSPDSVTLSADVAHIRRPDFYSSLYSGVLGDKHTFDTIFSRSLETFAKLFSSPNHICWLTQKVLAPESQGFRTFQEFLDTQRFPPRRVKCLQRIFGDDFISPGGLQSTQEIVKRLNLKPDEHVLDVGAGVGGSAFYMAEKHDAFVTGIDLSTNMISAALEKLNERNCPKVRFEVCDAAKRDFAPATFDVVYSRDSILYIADKKSLFASFLKWLKPGGRLLVSDFCCRSGASEQFTKDTAERGHHTIPIPEYVKTLEEAGFVKVKSENLTDQLIEFSKKELKTCIDLQEQLVKDFSDADYEWMTNEWKKRVENLEAGDHKWGLFYAEKSSKTAK